MSSIYIGIPLIHDQEFFHTIENCLAQADNPRDIHFGVYALCDNEFWEKWIYDFSLEHNMSLFTDELSWQNLGIGKGRIKAGSMYQGEDYVLSIDSHTLFGKHWDTLLIEAIERFSENIIFTGLAGHYYSDGENRSFAPHQAKLGYPKFTGQMYKYGSNEYNTMYPEYIDIHEYEDNGVMQCLLWNGNFAFSKSNFFNDLSDLPMHTEHWIQTAELLSKEYTLLTPLFDQPTIAHLYQDRTILHTHNGQSRWNYNDYLQPYELIKHQQLDYVTIWKDYKLNHIDRVKLLETYTGVKLA